MAAKVLIVLALAVAAVMAADEPMKKDQEKRQIFGTAVYPGYAAGAYPYAYAAPAAVAPVAPVATTYAAAPAYHGYAAGAYPYYSGYAAGAYPYYSGYAAGAYPYYSGYAARYAAAPAAAVVY